MPYEFEHCGNLFHHSHEDAESTNISLNEFNLPGGAIESRHHRRIW
jgi:hypothetical protein